jgi:hypothetical protein
MTNDQCFREDDGFPQSIREVKEMAVAWEERIEEIQREIQRAGRVDKTKEEIIAELRSTRKRLWETEYSRRYTCPG